MEYKESFPCHMGAVKEEHIEQQKDVAQRILPSVFRELVIATNEPFM
jgi:hypothetical protein